METSQAAPDQTTNKVTNMENSEETKDVSLDELESQAKVCLSAGDYENAVQTYGQALQIAINRHGEMHASAGKFYYSYGHALLTSYENNDQMLVGESVLDAFAAQHGEEEEEGEESSEAAAANPFGLPNAPTEAATDPNNPFGLPTSNPPLQQATDPADPFGLQAQAGNQIEVEEEEEESEEGESGPSEGDAPAQAEEAGNDDLQLSWENLECARAIFLKENDVPNILKAYIRIGDLEIAREQFTAAAEEYDSALTYLDQTVPTRQLAELFYLMGLCALGKPGNETDAADYFTRSKYTLQQFLDSTELKPEEKEDIEGMIAEIQEKLEDAVEQQDSLAQIRAQEPQEENAFDAPSTAAEPKELGVLGKRKREENQDESGKQLWQMEEKEEDPVIQYAEEPASSLAEQDQDQEEEKKPLPQNKGVKPIFRPTEDQAAAPHKFWDTQPVPKLSQSVVPMQQVPQPNHGPINPPMTVEEVRQTPYNISAAFEWVDVDIYNEEWAQKVYTLLLENYVEDDDNMFRFDYSVPFLRWALTPEGYRTDWHVGVVVKATGKLVGFISGIPAKLNVYDSKIDVAEINFLCVHKQLRTKRLAPVLIKEVTRRVNLQNVWQAVYTAGIVLPSPIGQCTYYHRSLNPKKLIEVGFSHMGQRMNMSRTIRLYALPDEPQIRGIRQMQYKDIAPVQQLLNSYLSNFSLTMDFSLKEIEHFFLPQEDVIYSYVVQDPETKEITDLCSFYSLTSSILQHPKHNKLKAAYSFYQVPGAHTLKELFYDLLIYAKRYGFDVFNALNAMDNETMFKDLSFGVGDGNLQYYLYNWGCEQLQPGKVGLILV